MNFVQELIQAQNTATVPILQLSCINESPELSALRQRLENLAQTINPVEIYTPVNAKTEQEKFIANFQQGIVENPTFVYDEAKLQRIADLRKPLEELLLAKNFSTPPSDEEKFLVSLLIDRINDAITSTRIAGGILMRNDFITSKVLAQKYGKISVIPLAEAIALHESDQSAAIDPILTPSEQERLINMELNAQDIKAAFQFALDKHDFSNLWDIRISPKARAIDVRDKSEYGHPVIVIPCDRVVNGKKLLELIGHEIECHVRQSMNGVALLHGFGGGALKDDDETLYEGLAKISDINFARNYFGEVITTPEPYYIMAGSLAEKGHTFHEVYSEIFQLMLSAGKPEQPALKSAWTATYRVFRGSTDPGNRYGYVQPKDKAYFEGYQIARQMEGANLGYLLDVGAVSPSTLLRIAQQYKITPYDVPYKNLGVVQRLMCEKLLAS